MEGIRPHPACSEIVLSIGEPKHSTPAFIEHAFSADLSGLAKYPTTLGSPALRESIADWLSRRFKLAGIDPNTQIIPVNGSREALFSFAQAVIDSSRPRPTVICPNPFYQIYEGAAILAGARPYFINTVAADNFTLHFEQIPEAIWTDTQLVYVCSPGNPTGSVMQLKDWETLFALSTRYGFVIAADECYSEIYFDEQQPPLGGLQAATQLGNSAFSKLVVFASLSKRSNVPGMRSGFVAGDSQILAKFLLYRTYHGCAMSPTVQAASRAAWQDEAHVVTNRQLYREKFSKTIAILMDCMDVNLPQAGFYLWVNTPIDDSKFAQELYRHYNVLVLPGSYLARTAHDINPGNNFVRIALVASLDECLEAANRIKQLVAHLAK